MERSTFLAKENKPQAAIVSRALLRFPAKIFEVINHCSNHYPNIASWDERDGTAFIIHDKLAFKLKYLVSSCWGGQGDILFESFQRQLKIYGFKRLTGKTNRKDIQLVNGSNNLVYQHENFRKGCPGLLEKITTFDIGAASSKKEKSKAKTKGADTQNDMQRLEKKVDILDENFSKLLTLIHRTQVRHNNVQKNYKTNQAESSQRLMQPQIEVARRKRRLLEQNLDHCEPDRYARFNKNDRSEKSRNQLTCNNRGPAKEEKNNPQPLRVESLYKK